MYTSFTTTTTYITYNIILYSKYDLYSKSKVLVDVEKVKPYYQSLIEKVRTNSDDLGDLVFFIIPFVVLQCGVLTLFLA